MQETLKQVDIPDDILYFFQEIKDLYRDTDRQFKETDRQFKETDRQFKDTDQKFKETDRQFKETDRQLKETGRQLKETDQIVKETQQIIQAQSREITRLERLFTSQWGKLIESLVEGDLVNILRRFGLNVENTSTRLRGRTSAGQNYEFDILAHDGEILVVVEVKTTLRPEDVNDFTDKLSQFKTWLPRYAANAIHGAMAYLQADTSAVTMAERRGLLVIRATGDSAAIVNSAGFKPKAW